MKLQEPSSDPVPQSRSIARPSSADDLWAGLTMGRYRLVHQLGKGGMGVVYEAEDLTVPRSVALKLIAERVAELPGVLKRFLREARSASKLNHPNLVEILDVAEHDGTNFLVMELLRGGSALGVLQTEGSIPWPRATHIVADVCRGLAAAHQAGLIHRDIKPGNILLADDGRAKLGDFGLVKDGSVSSGSLTGSGDLIGTPHYMSPEQCKAEELDQRSDLYSLGATYFALLVGRPPYDEENPMQVMFAHCARPVPDPRQSQPDIPEECVKILQRALAKQRSQRYATAAEMLADLEKITVRQRDVQERASAERETVVAPRGAAFPRSRNAGEAATSVGGRVQAVAFSPDGTMLAAALRDGPGGVHLWRVKSGERRGLSPSEFLDPGWAGNPVGVRCLTFSPDGTVLAAGCRPGLGVSLWDLENHLEQKLPVMGRKIQALAFSATGKHLATGLGPLLGTEGVFLCTWKLDEGWKHPSFCEPKTPIQDLAFLPFGELLLLAGRDGNVRLWDAGARELLYQVNTKYQILSLAVAPRGKEAVLAGVRLKTPVLQFLNLVNKKIEVIETKTRGWFYCVSYSPDGKVLAAAHGKEVTLFDAATRQPLETLKGHEAEVRGLAFSPDGKTLATAGWDKTIRLWDL